MVVYYRQNLMLWTELGSNKCKPLRVIQIFVNHDFWLPSKQEGELIDVYIAIILSEPWEAAKNVDGAGNMTQSIFINHIWCSPS